MEKTMELVQKTLLENKIVILFRIVIFLIIIIIILSVSLCFEKRHFSRNYFIGNENCFQWESGQWKMQRQNMGMENWPIWPDWIWSMWEGLQEKRLFERFCQSWTISSGDEFVKNFRIWTQNRTPKIDFIKNNLEKIISRAKKEKHDTARLEEQLSWLNKLISDFESWSNNFNNNPQDFCKNHQNWMDINTKIKEIMQNVFEEMEKFR